MRLTRDIGFAHAYSFKYSPRPGTPAAMLDEQIEEPVKSARLSELQALLGEQQISFNTTCVGKTVPVLFERAGREAGQLIGRSPYLQAVHASLPAAGLGEILPVTIERAGPNSLSGRVGGLAAA